MDVRSNWKLKLFAGVVALAALTAPAFAQINIYLNRTPPPQRYEVLPPTPGDGYVWTQGFWGNRDGRYVWQPGVWQRPPYAGGYWVHPHYDHYAKGWQMREGYWGHEDHGDHRDYDDDHDNGKHRGKGEHYDNGKHHGRGDRD